jgi:hypothetical protein
MDAKRNIFTNPNKHVKIFFFFVENEEQIVFG